MKSDLGLMQTHVDTALKGNGGLAEMRAVFSENLEQLKGVVAQLNTAQDHTRLTQLRSVRGYMEDLVMFGAVEESLATNGAELGKARQSVANLVWFFNNKEVSTKALEQQDPEAFKPLVCAGKAGVGKLRIQPWASHLKLPISQETWCLKKHLKVKSPHRTTLATSSRSCRFFSSFSSSTTSSRGR